MKRLPLFAAILLLGVALWIAATQRSMERPVVSLPEGSDAQERGELSRKAFGSSSVESKAGDVPLRAPEERDAASRVIASDMESRLMPVSQIVQRRTLPMTQDFVRNLASGPDAVSFALPDGRMAVGVIEQRYMDKEGNPSGVEGRLEKPNEGRFRFRIQPPGDLAGPVTGSVVMEKEVMAFRVLKGADGGSLLTELPKGEVICLLPPSPIESLDGQPEEIPTEHPINIGIPAYQNGIVPLQSLPTAVGVIYLDFDGQDGPHEGWGDFDAVAPGVTNTQVRDVWARVAEDFAPFNLNVTTDLQIFLDAPQNSRQRCIITPTKNAAPTAGGVAYFGSFNSTGDSPCWAFYSTGKNAAEVISHEIGHTLDLSHDGRKDPFEDYYGGHGTDPVGWAPIMGVGYSKNLTQWSKGEYTRANQTQDDLNIITTENNNVDYRADDAGPGHDTAAVLEIFGNGTVDDEGIISHSTDVDAFRFTTTGGALSLTLAPVASGPNLDLSASIHDAAGNQLLVSNPDTALNATLALNLAAGEYTVRVDGVGRADPLVTGYTDYSSLGHYTMAGTIAGAVGPSRFAIAENSAAAANVGTPGLRNSHGGSSLLWEITAGNTGSPFAINPTTGQITVATPAVLNYESLSGTWLTPPIYELTVSVTDSVNPELNETLRVVVTVTDVNEVPVLSPMSLTALARTLPGTVLGRLNASDPDEFDALTFSIVAGNADGKFAVTPAGEIVATGSWDVVQPSYSLTVRATDRGSPSFISNAVISITTVAVAAEHQPGRVYRTIYDGITASGIAGLTSSASFPASPSREFPLTELADNTRGDNYGSTVRCWLIAPVSGTYRFWIAGDDAISLLFNAAGNPAAATQIASRTSATSYKSFPRSGTQQSSTFNLTAGQVCYLEARQKENTGGDHVAVGWEILNSSTSAVIVPQEVIPGRYLSPHEMNYAPKVTALAAAAYRHTYQGATIAQPTAVDVNSVGAVSWSITGGNAGSLFGIDPASGRIFVANSTALAASTATSIPITVTATDSNAAGGNGTVTVTLRDPGFITTSGVIQEFWDGVTSANLSTLYSLPRYVADRPDRLVKKTSVDSGENVGDSYGARIRVLVVPPTTGNYRFYVSADDNSTLRLSTDATPGNATQIASVSGFTTYKVWTEKTSQTSAEIPLIAGQRYFLEAIVKEGTGGDHVEVAWTGPGITTPTILGDAVTEPYDSNVAPAFASSSYSFNLPKIITQGMAAGSVAATDAPFEGICYAIVSGNSGGGFAIHPQSGAITVAAPANLTPGATYNLQVGAQDSGHGGNFAPRAGIVMVSIKVSEPDQPPQFAGNPAELGNFPVNQPISTNLNSVVSDPGDTLTFSLVSGPAWLTLSSSGVLSGNPTLAHFGTHGVTVSVTDAFAHTVQGVVNLNVSGSSPVAAGSLALTSATSNFVFGAVNSGASSAAAVADNASLILREGTSGVSPNQLSLLEHVWTFSTPVNRLATLRVKAHHSVNSEGDDFRFTVSTDGGATYQDAVLVTTIAYSSLIQTYTFPTGSSGQALVKVVDTDRTPGRSAIHNLAIDLMMIDLAGNQPPTLTDAAFDVTPHAPVDTVLGIITGSASEADQTLSWVIAAGNEAGLFSISQDGTLRVAGDVPASPSNYSLIVAATDSGPPALSNYATITIQVANAQLIASGDTLVLPSGSHSYESLRIEGTLRLTGDAALNVSGSFVNQGVLDIINWNGTLPPGLVNEGVILDRSDVKILSSAKNGASFDLTAPGYAGHLYQLKTAADLSGPWVDSGEPVIGTGTPSAPQTIPFSAPVSGDRRFYRVVVTAAP